MKIDCYTIFARLRTDGNYDIFWESGEAVTQMPEVTGVYAVYSGFGIAYEHAGGIVLTIDDVEKLGIEIEE